MNVAISMSEARASLRRVKPWTWVILGGVCSILVGVGSIGWPRETLRVVAILFAVQLIAASLFRCIVVLSSEGRPGHMITMGALAGLSLVAGVLLLEDPTLSLGILAVVLGTYWLVHGVIEMIEAGGYRVWTDRAWTFVSGAMAIIVAIIIIAEATPIPFSVPYHTLMALSRVLGSWLILYGGLLLIRGVRRFSEASERRTTTEHPWEPDLG